MYELKSLEKDFNLTPVFMESPESVRSRYNSAETHAMLRQSEAFDRWTNQELSSEERAEAHAA